MVGAWYECQVNSFWIYIYWENKEISFCINMNKNAKEKLSLGQKIKTDTAGANFPNSRCN